VGATHAKHDVAALLAEAATLAVADVGADLLQARGSRTGILDGTFCCGSWSPCGLGNVAVRGGVRRDRGKTRQFAFPGQIERLQFFSS
jgi:hypothetical protein